MAFSRLKHLFSANKCLNNEIQIKGPQGPRFSLNDKKVINLSSSDYLGLCSNPKTIKYFQSSIDTYGFGLSSGRIIKTINSALIINFTNNLNHLLQSSSIKKTVFSILLGMIQIQEFLKHFYRLMMKYLLMNYQTLLCLMEFL